MSSYKDGGQPTVVRFGHKTSGRLRRDTSLHCTTASHTAYKTTLNPNTCGLTGCLKINPLSRFSLTKGRKNKHFEKRNYMINQKISNNLNKKIKKQQLFINLLTNFYKISI